MLNTCRNCKHKYKGNFCHNCGQKAATHNIDFKFIIHEVPHSAFHLDKGILYTIKELTLRPGKTIRGFLEGKRIQHYPPLMYVILITTVYILIKSLQLHLGFDEFKASQEFQRKHQLSFFLTLIPSYALIYWLFHKKFGYNYWQYLVSQTFMTGHLILIVIIPNVLFFCFPETRTLVKDFFIVLAFGYLIYANFNIHKIMIQNKWKLLFRELVCFFIATSISLGLTVVTFGEIYKYLKK